MAHTLPKTALHQQRQERKWRRDEKERATEQIMDSDALPLSLFLLSHSLLYLHGAYMSTWSKAVYWQGGPRAERRGWIDGDGVCVGIKGHAASIAEQVQRLIGSGNGWSM